MNYGSHRHTQPSKSRPAQANLPGRLLSWRSISLVRGWVLAAVILAVTAGSLRADSMGEPTPSVLPPDFPTTVSSSAPVTPIARPHRPSPGVPTSAPSSGNLVVNGDYKDSSGDTHHWETTPGHGLLWEGKPYFPVGCVLTPKTWTDGPTNDNWAADIAQLERLEHANIHDVLLKPGAAGL
ncbi:MAG: hypothetical protein ACLQVD_04715, partial [Capsulimonadaceae bacterium]